MKQLLIPILCFCSLNIAAQGLYSESKNDTGFMKITADARLSALISKGGYKGRLISSGGTTGTSTDTGLSAGTDISGRAVPYRAKGVRIQIYSGPDRGKANQVKMSFMKNFPGIRAYLMYAAPNFRVRVGDFKSRSDAMALYHQLLDNYKAVMIVPDMVTITPPKKQQDEAY